MAKGSNINDSTWNIDGVVVTDMAAIGASPTYFDYDAFEEIQYSTGGNDVKLATGGVALNFVTKRGTNAFHGGRARLPDARRPPVQQPARRAGVAPAPERRAGHPPAQPRRHLPRQGRPHPAGLGLRRRPGRPDRQGQAVVLRLLRHAGHPHRAPQRHAGQDAAQELQRQAELAGHPERHAVGLLVLGQEGEVRPRRRATRPHEDDSLLWNQDDERRDGTPPGLYKLEWNHIFSPNFFLNAKDAYYNRASASRLTGATMP